MALIQRYQLFKLLTPFTVCLLFVTLSACTQNVDISTSEGSGIALPQLVQRLSIPSDGTLSATMTIDEGTSNAKTHNMQVDSTNNQLSFQGSVSTGTHSFLIELFYTSSSVSKIRLVSASRTINIASDQSFNFNDGEYIYDDRDNDNITNVVEIENNTDPYSDSSKPDVSVADDNYEPNNNYSTAYDITSLRDVFLNDDVVTNTRGGRMSVSDNIDLFKITIDANTTSSIQLQTNTDNGIFWIVRNFINNTEIDVPVEIFEEEDRGNFIHQKATVSNLQSRDYYVFFFSPDDAKVNGTYSFGWK